MSLLPTDHQVPNKLVKTTRFIQYQVEELLILLGDFIVYTYDKIEPVMLIEINPYYVLTAIVLSVSLFL